MKPCPVCGKEVRLGATKIRVMRKHGIYHYIAHCMTGAPPCVPGEWSTVMMKPYPKSEADKPRVAMVQRWDALERGTVVGHVASLS